MGLDMYLDATMRLSKFDNEKMAMELRGMFDIPPAGNLESVDLSFEIGYWRKANQIHKWFIDNCANGKDDCSNVYVRRDDLEKLLDTVTKVLDSTTLVKATIVNGYAFIKGERKANLVEGEVLKDATVAQMLLPCQEGFFFGSTGYDQWYWYDLENTKKIIEGAMKLNPKMRFQYRASW